MLLYHTWEENSAAVMIFAGFIAVSVLFELLYGQMVRGHFLDRPYC